MAYKPALNAETANLPAGLLAELHAISRALCEPVPYQLHAVLHKAPAKPVEGMCVVADGKDWDPGGGAGRYLYINGKWSK